jgi:phenylalanyl-tRNA synthetase alpha chain
LYEVPKLATFTADELDRAVAELKAALQQEARAVRSEAEWKTFRDRWVSRKNGILTHANELWLKAAPKEAKREVGQRINDLKAVVESTVEDVKTFTLMPTMEHPPDVTSGDLRATAMQMRLDSSRLDISLPGIRRPLGAEHPILRTMEEFVGVFKAMGYSVESGPEIETDWFNFEALNFAENHPARDMADTIFVAGQQNKRRRDQLLLRTHTSPVQIRSMMKTPPPIRVVCPGKVFRHDAPDATHSPMFHQIEALAVDTNIKFSDLKGSLDHAMKMLYGSSVKTRFQPSFFPFTEPSAEIYISCPFCNSKGCRICKQSGWIEMGGSGMVHPNVFRSVAEYGYDPEKVSGFAFGMGVDRLAALRWGIDDIQLFFQGDVRFLEQFA